MVVQPHDPDVLIARAASRRIVRNQQAASRVVITPVGRSQLRPPSRRDQTTSPSARKRTSRALFLPRPPYCAAETTTTPPSSVAAAPQASLLPASLLSFCQTVEPGYGRLAVARCALLRDACDDGVGLALNAPPSAVLSIPNTFSVSGPPIVCCQTTFPRRSSSPPITHSQVQVASVSAQLPASSGKISRFAPGRLSGVAAFADKSSIKQDIVMRTTRSVKSR